MDTYAEKPPQACKRHTPWSWMKVKESAFHMHLKCSKCGWRKIVPYFGSPREKTADDIEWLKIA